MEDMAFSALATNKCPGCAARDELNKALSDEVDRLTGILNRRRAEKRREESGEARIIDINEKRSNVIDF